MTAPVDVCVVGAGPAGLAAATWLGRYRRSTVVLDSAEHRNRWVAKSHGYLGADPVAPAELLDRVRSDLGQYATVVLREGKAVSAQCSVDGDFSVSVDGGAEVHARRMVLAMGVRDEFPDIANFFDFYGRSVFHCPSCDGFEARDQAVVVFGWSAAVAGFASSLLEWAASVMVVTDGRPFEGERDQRQQLADLGVHVVTDEVTELCGVDGELEAVRLRAGGDIGCARAFFTIAHHPRTLLAEQLGCDLDEAGYLAVDSEGRTSVPGVYGAGDVVPGMQFIQTAAAEGAKAGIACALSLTAEILGRPDDRHDRPERQPVLGGQTPPPDEGFGQL